MTALKSVDNTTRPVTSESWTGGSAHWHKSELDERFDKWLEAKPYRNVLFVVGCLAVVAGVRALEKIDWSLGLGNGLLVLSLTVVGTVTVLVGWFAATFEIAKTLLKKAVSNGHESGGVAVYYATYGVSFLMFLVLMRVLTDTMRGAA